MSVGVIIAAVIIYVFPQAKIADPICTYFFSFIVAFTSFPIMKQCFSVLMESSPVDVDYNAVLDDVWKVEGVEDVHDFHLWSLS
jgi:cation diffusion facilitator family transporter